MDENELSNKMVLLNGIRVIIPDAGASTSDRMPIQSELFKVFFAKRSIFEKIKKKSIILINLLKISLKKEYKIKWWHYDN